MDPRAGLDDVEKRKFLTLPGLELRPLSRPASRYTDCAIPAPVTTPTISNRCGNLKSGKREMVGDRGCR
jgi:hypothetical protein